jgi:hypothetical protein
MQGTLALVDHLACQGGDVAVATVEEGCHLPGTTLLQTVEQVRSSQPFSNRQAEESPEPHDGHSVRDRNIARQKCIAKHFIGQTQHDFVRAWCHQYKAASVFVDAANNVYKFL